MAGVGGSRYDVASQIVERKHRPDGVGGLAIYHQLELGRQFDWFPPMAGEQHTGTGASSVPMPCWSWNMCRYVGLITLAREDEEIRENFFERAC